MKPETLQDLYVEQLRDLYSAESQIVDALPIMAQNATNPQLKQGFLTHLEESKVQRDRLDTIIRGLGKDPSGHTCQAMKGLIKEASEFISETHTVMSGDSPSDVIDAGLIANSQRIEHYEIAGYGTVCTYAEILGRHDDLAHLKLSIAEEKATDEKLTMIAESVVNPAAARA